MVAAAAVCGLLAAPSLAAAEPAPFGHACKAQNGVRFCPTESLEERVPTFDEVPLDVDVTLPPTGEGPFPAIVMIHGWGGSKGDFESNTPEGNGNGTSSYRVTIALGSIFMGITCSVCGSDKVIRAGACGVCTECGTSQGCS